LLISFDFKVINNYLKNSQERDGGQKSPSCKWEELFNYLSFVEAESHLSARLSRLELAPYLVCDETGCQGFIGPLPSAFLDK
jgi:hypothetical protein